MAEVFSGFFRLLIRLTKLVVGIVLGGFPPGQPVLRLGAAVGLGQLIEGSFEEGLHDRVVFLLEALDQGVDSFGFLVDAQTVDHDPANGGVLVVERIVEMLVEDRVVHLGEGDGHALANRAVLVLLESLDHLFENLVAGGGRQRLDGSIPVEPGLPGHDLYEHAELALVLRVHLRPGVVPDEGIGSAQSLADLRLADALLLAAYRRG